jgi:hypothetical protein
MSERLVEVDDAPEHAPRRTVATPIVTLLILGALTVASAAIIPLAVPIVATAGGVASLVAGSRHWDSRVRWLPLLMFVLALGVSVVVDLGPITSGT